MSVPKAIVELKGWQGSFHPPPEVRAREPDLPPDAEGTELVIVDDPDTGGIKVYAAPKGGAARAPAPSEADAS